mmetsp:Transcript_43608/g.115172  ORF Transcript_43608/g.115172 Transcript_43608/m.115172 type:complete len:295 (+) Transcript_43608:1001-1885(+)
MPASILYSTRVAQSNSAYNVLHVASTCSVLHAFSGNVLATSRLPHAASSCDSVMPASILFSTRVAYSNFACNVIHFASTCTVVHASSGNVFATSRLLHAASSCDIIMPASILFSSRIVSNFACIVLHFASTCTVVHASSVNVFATSRLLHTTPSSGVFRRTTTIIHPTRVSRPCTGCGVQYRNDTCAVSGSASRVVHGATPLSWATRDESHARAAHTTAGHVLPCCSGSSGVLHWSSSFCIPHATRSSRIVYTTCSGLCGLSCLARSVASARIMRGDWACRHHGSACCVLHTTT